MKKNLIVLLSILMTVNVNSQTFGNRIKNKVLNKLENRAEEKVDKAINNGVDKSVDKTEEKVKESVKKEKTTSDSKASNSNNQNDEPSQEDMAKYLEMMGGGAVTIDEYPDLNDILPSSFIGSFEMEMTSTKNGKVKDEGTIGWYIDQYDVVIVPMVTSGGSSIDSRMIMNRKKGVMTMLTDNDGEKTGFVMKMKTIVVDMAQVDQGEDDLANMNVKVYKNEKQTIEGYSCYKVVVADDEFETVAWVTEDVDLDMEKVMSFMNMKTKNNAYQDKFGQISGWPVKTVSTDKKTNEVNTMVMKNIKKGSIPSSITSTEGYKLMQMPDFGGQIPGME